MQHGRREERPRVESLLSGHLESLREAPDREERSAFLVTQRTLGKYSAAHSRGARPSCVAVAVPPRKSSAPRLRVESNGRHGYESTARDERVMAKSDALQPAEAVFDSSVALLLELRDALLRLRKGQHSLRVEAPAFLFSHLTNVRCRLSA
jgi:hypothetical protein